MRQLVDVTVDASTGEGFQTETRLVFEGGVTVILVTNHGREQPFRWEIRSNPPHERDMVGVFIAHGNEPAATMAEVLARAMRETIVPGPIGIEPPGGLRRPRRHYKNGRPPHK